MVKRIFIRVVGFTDAERHALNTVFRLSQQADPGRSHSYEPWLPDNPEPASLALIDGSDGTAAQELSDLHRNPSMGLIWVGAVSPAKAWRSFNRPLSWPAVLTAMDMYFEPKPSLDFDLSSETLPAQLDAAATHTAPLLAERPVSPSALLADPDPEARMFLRSLLSAMGITQIDEAATVIEAKALLTHNSYQFVCVDLGLNDRDPWSVMADASQARVRLITGLSIGLGDKLSAKMHRCIAMQKPLQSNKLGEMLRIL
jgi:CheY-like chemotaxis protein